MKEKPHDVVTVVLNIAAVIAEIPSIQEHQQSTREHHTRKQKYQTSIATAPKQKLARRTVMERNARYMQFNKQHERLNKAKIAEHKCSKILM